MSAPRGRCANEENARAFHQGPDTVGVHREAGYIDAALFSMVYHVTPVVVSKAGSIYHVVLNPTSLQPTQAYSTQSSLFFKNLGPQWARESSRRAEQGCVRALLNRGSLIRA